MSDPQFMDLAPAAQWEHRTRAIKFGCQPCPNCERGWLQFKIKSASSECALCDYTNRPGET